MSCRCFLYPPAAVGSILCLPLSCSFWLTATCDGLFGTSFPWGTHVEPAALKSSTQHLFKQGHSHWVPVVLGYLTPGASDTLPAQISVRDRAHWTCATGWRQQKLSVSLPKFRGTFYQHPAINSASRKVKCDPVQCSRAPGCCDSSAAALWACVRLIYCNCWPWLVLYT